MKIPDRWKQLDKDAKEHVFVHTTDHDPHYYDKSVEIVKESGSWAVYARVGRDRQAQEVHHLVFASEQDAQVKAIELMNDGF